MMHKMREAEISVLRYRKEFPILLLYQLVSKGLALGVLILFRTLTGMILWNMDEPLINGGTMPYLLRSIEGWLIVLGGFISLMIFVFFDTCLTITLCDAVVRQEKWSCAQILRKTIDSLYRFRGGKGILSILYNSLTTPLSLGTVGICVTTGYAIPEFIKAITGHNWILWLSYLVILIILLIVGFFFVFSYHLVLLNNDTFTDALGKSVSIIKKHWKHFLCSMLKSFIEFFVFEIAGIIILFVLPSYVFRLLPLSEYIFHTGVTFETWITTAFVIISGLMFAILFIFKLTVLYDLYTSGARNRVVLPSREGQYDWIFSSLLYGMIIVTLIGSAWFSRYFDSNFPEVTDVNIIAHRAGGTLANENTLLGLKRAIGRGVAAAEIDVQRTVDGYYIINHDATFLRTCRKNVKACDITLEEVKKLWVRNAQNPLKNATEVATFEDMLDAAKGRIKLYIELKGVTADALMAQDLYQMVEERGMLEDCVFISMDYNLIDYLETVHSDAQTGYICYFSFEDTEHMNCDALLIESATATPGNIRKIHDEGKEVNVWTVNGLSAMFSFMIGDADGVITDSVTAAKWTKRLLYARNEELRVLKKLIG